MKNKIVYGARKGGSVRVIAEVESIAEFMRLTGMSRSEATNYGCETGNTIEVATARANPGKALYRSDNSDNTSGFYDYDGKRVPAVGVEEYLAEQARQRAEDDARQAARDARLIKVGDLTLTVGKARQLARALELAVREADRSDYA